MKLFRKIYGYLNTLISRGYWYNNVKFRDCRKFWTYNTFNTDVVNLGSSSAVCAFDYSEIPLKCANWALNTNPLSGDLAILKNYCSFLKEGAVVLIPLCPFSSLAGSYSIQEDRYYTFLYPSSIPNYSIRRHQKIKEEMRHPINIYPVVSLYKDLISFFKTTGTTILSEAQMELDAAMWMQSWMKEFSVKNFENPLSLINVDSIKDAKQLINEMIAFCKTRGLRPVVIIPPVYHTLGERFTPAIRNVVIKSLVGCLEDKTIYYLDYMDDPRFNNDKNMFRNSFLMNNQGAIKFTKMVLEDLKLF